MNSDKEEIIIKKILSQGTELKAPHDLSHRVLATWKAEESISLSYPPLIPIWIWWALGLIFSGIVFWVLNNSTAPTGESIITSTLQRALANLEFSFPQLDPIIITAFVVTLTMLFINAYAYKLHFHQEKSA